MTANKQGYLLDFFHKNGGLMSVCFWFVVIGQWTTAAIGNREWAIGAPYNPDSPFRFVTLSKAKCLREHNQRTCCTCFTLLDSGMPPPSA